MTEARDRWLLGAFVLSGAAGLGYEILWTRLLGLALGSETLGVLGVLAGFFGGMAIGAAALHERARKSADPVRLFVVLELTAAAFAVVSPWWLHALAQQLPAMVGPIAGDNDGGPALALSLGVAAVVLLPGTFCLGATLPALVEARRRACPEDLDGRGVGRLYAANTAGAVLGVLLTVHALLPAVGMIGGAAALATLGVGAAVIARRWAKSVSVTSPVTSSTTEPIVAPDVDASRDPDAEVAREPWLLLALLAGTGLAGVGLEVVAVQILSQVLENTIYTFAHVLAVYLAGTAIGAAVYTRYAARAVRGRPATVAAALLLAHGVAVIWAGRMLGAAPALIDGIAGERASAASDMLAEAVAAMVVLGPATLLMGALFCHVAGLVSPRGIGRAYALNTLGGAAAPFAFGVWAIESLGYRDALFAVVYAYLVLFGAFTWFRRFKPVPQIAGILGVVVLTAAAPESLLLGTTRKDDQTVYIDEDWEVIESRETLLGAVIVGERRPAAEAPPGPPLRRLYVGKNFRMGGARGLGERRMGEIPLLLHPDPRRALFLGVGTGATLGAVRNHPSLEHVDAVELVPAVLDQLHHFRDINGDIGEDERVHLHAADARRFVAASHEQYDVIVADLFHPGQDGAGNLYAIEHFENVRRHLAPGGVFGQWLPTYQLDAQMLRVIARTFLEVFGEVHVLLGIYNVQHPAIVLIGFDAERSSGPLVIDVDQLSRRLQAPGYHDEMLTNRLELLEAYLLDRPGVVDFVGSAGVNSDLMPRVSTHAPRSAYEESPTRGRDNLLELLEASRPLPVGLLTAADPTAVASLLAEVADRREALRCFLYGESALLDTPGIPGLVAATGHYLDAYRLAPQFPSARGRLFEAARAADDLAERIFPAMLERTPQEPSVWNGYLAHLRRRGDEPRLRQAQAEARSQLGLPDTGQP